MAANVYSLKFDGNKVVILDTTKTMTVRNLSAFTLMAWAKIGSGSTDPLQRAYVERQGTGSKIRLAMTPLRDLIRFEFGPKDGTDDINYDYRPPTGVTFDDDLWTHLAFSASISSNAYNTIINGQVVATGELTLPAETEAVSDTAMSGSGVYVGNHILSGSTYSRAKGWKGSLDEIILFDTALSASAIEEYIDDKAHWTIEETDNILNYWKLDNGTYASPSTSTTDAKNSKTGNLYYVNSSLTASAINTANNPWQFDRPFRGDGAVDAVAPTAPTLVSGGVTVTNDTAVVVWTGVRDGETGLDVLSNSIGYVQEFEAHVATTNDFSVMVDSAMTQTNTVTFEDLVGNTTHYFRVRAIDAAGNASSWSSTVSKTTDPDADLTPPAVPENLTATSITHNSFTLGWDDVADGDLEGYYVDVARDPNFLSYVFNFQGASTANDFLAITGVNPLTTYYARVYAYDTSGNVSNPSTTYAIQTSQPPDVSPPTVVILDSVTSIASRAATINWDASQDDTFVSHYLVDYSAFEDFTEIYAAEEGNFTILDLNVGNVLSHRLTALFPDSVVYYRVRAVDSVGNESDNQSEVASFTTAISTVDDISVYETQVVAGEDSYTNSAASSTNYGSEDLLRVEGTTKETFMQFDLLPFSGDFITATVNFYVVSGSSLDDYLLTMDNVTFEEDTVTHATKPTVTSATKTFNAFNDGEWISIDVTDLLTGADTYTVRIYKTSGSDLITIRSKDDEDNYEEAPFINLEVNPSSATQPDALSVDGEHHIITNQHTNPEFLVNTTGWTVGGSGGTRTLNRVSDSTSWFGGFAGEFTLSGAHSSASLSYSPMIPAVQGDLVSVSFAVLRVSGAEDIRWSMVEYNATPTVQTSSSLISMPYSDTANWTVIQFNYIVTDIDTTQVLPVIYGSANSTAQVFRFTGVTVVVNGGPNVAPFTGTTDSADWTGTAGQSTSTMEVAALDVVGSYLGDSNDDNSSVLEFSDNSINYYPVPSYLNVDEGARQHLLYPAALWIRNYLSNPSFEDGTTGWNSFTSTISSVTTDGYVYGNSALKVVIAASAAWGGGTRSLGYSAKQGEVWRGSGYVTASVGDYIDGYVSAIDTLGNILASSAVGFTEARCIGDGTAQRVVTAALTMPANTTNVRLSFRTFGNVAGNGTVPAELTFYVDGASLEKASTVGPYVDGDFGGLWLGAPHKGPSLGRILPETTYTIRQTYTDPDGVYDSQGEPNTTMYTEYTVGAAPTNTLTMSPITFTSTTTSLTVTMPFTGDDDQDAAVYYVYRRADKTTWTRVVTDMNYETHTISSTIENLVAGTRYIVRLYATDPDGVYGGTLEGSEYYVETEDTITSLVGSSGLADITIMYGGFVLTGAGQNSIGVETHTAFNHPERRLQIEALARQHGSLLLSDLWGTKTIEVTGHIYGDTREELQDNITALSGALARQGLQTLIVDTLAPRRLFYNAICESFSMPEDANKGFTSFEWSATFLCPDPFAYEQKTTTSQLAVSNASPDVTLFNAGNVMTPAGFEITTDFSRPAYVTITNDTTGELVRPYEPVSAGDVIIIDSDKRLVTKNGVELSYAGGFINLAPGNNNLAVSLTSVGSTPTINYIASWNNRYI